MTKRILSKSNGLAQLRKWSIKNQIFNLKMSDGFKDICEWLIDEWIHLSTLKKYWWRLRIVPGKGYNFPNYNDYSTNLNKRLNKLFIVKCERYFNDHGL